jgi:MinD-like ATPase involved in chromosome partitioning or flagellar assembly
VLLLDLDLEAPALAVRIARPPRPDVTDAAEEVHIRGTIPDAALHQIGDLRVLVGSHRAEEPTPSVRFVDDLITAASTSGLHTVVDAGPRRGDDPILQTADEVVLVAEGTPTGLVRAAALVADWTAPQPRLVLNRVPDRSRDDVVKAARRWIGLEPEAVVAERRSISRSSRQSLPPARPLRRALRIIEALP